MTKVRILDEQLRKKKKLKPIEFKFYIINGDGEKWEPIDYENLPYNWKFIDLICKNWRNEGFDLMRAYDNDENGLIALGHFNDGVVE